MTQPGVTVVFTVQLYIQHLQETGKYKGSTLFGVFAILKKFWRIALNGDLEKEIPAVKDMLKAFQKNDSPKTKATVFSADDVAAIYDMKMDTTTLPLAAFIAVSVAMAGRGCEVTGMHRSQLTKTMESSSSRSYYIVELERAKQEQAEINEALICDPAGVRILDMYTAVLDRGTFFSV